MMDTQSVHQDKGDILEALALQAITILFQATKKKTIVITSLVITMVFSEHSSTKHLWIMMSQWN